MATEFRATLRPKQQLNDAAQRHLKLVSTDGLANVMTGAGTSADKRAHAFYAHRVVDPAQVQAAYRNSWLMRKIVDLPPSDMTRERRDWQAEKDQIKEIRKAERKFSLWAKVQRALQLGGLGGGAIIIGDGTADAMQPMGDTAKPLQYLHVVSRYRLSIGALERDPGSPWFDEPTYFELHGQTGQVRIHPSRVIAFKGKPVPDDLFATEQDRYWGDPIYRTVQDAVQNADMAQNGFASLIDEAQYDVIGIPDMMQNLGTPGYEAKLMERLSLARAGKSVHRSLVRDSAETWETRKVEWSGMPDIIRTYLSIVAGAADIPATRLLGKAPDGMNATGDGDERNYVTMIATRQENELRPALDRIDPLLLAAASVSMDDDLEYEFPPLVEMTEKEKAEIAKSKAETITQYANNGTVPVDALVAAVPGMLIADGTIPGLDQAMEGLSPEPADPNLDPNGPPQDPSKLQANDAEPRTLYVRRDVVNWQEIEAWAKGQGFATTVGAKMHVTVLFSRTPVDWLKMGESRSTGDGKGQLTINPGGPRLVEPLGDGGAVVLLFSSTDLQWRHRSMIEAGASSDYGEYQPHVSISWDAADVDLSNVEPYRGKIVLGPEIFEEVKENWKSTITEDGLPQDA